MTSPAGFLLAYWEPGEKVTKEEWDDWYNNEHMPALTTVPGLLSVDRWVAHDGQKPITAVTLDLASCGVLQSPELISLMQNASEREKKLLKDAETVDRRAYEVYAGTVLPPSNLYDSTKPAAYMLLVGISVKPGSESELNGWYDEEHIPMLSKCPGWIRSRRLVLKSQGAETEENGPPKFLAIHEWASMEWADSDELKAAVSTPWRERVRQNFVAYERRTFKHHSSWEKK